MEKQKTELISHPQTIIVNHKEFMLYDMIVELTALILQYILKPHLTRLDNAIKACTHLLYLSRCKCKSIICSSNLVIELILIIPLLYYVSWIVPCSKLWQCVGVSISIYWRRAGLRLKIGLREDLDMGTVFSWRKYCLHRCAWIKVNPRA